MQLHQVASSVIQTKRQVKKIIKVGPKIQPSIEPPAKATECRVEEIVTEEIPLQDRATSIDICALGVVCSIGGHYYGWNRAFSTGFAPYATSQILMGIAYVVYMSCSAEICGKIAFSGGSYGLSRVTLGFYWGFIVGFFELIEYTTCISVSALYVGQFCTKHLDWDDRLEPLIWLLELALMVFIFQLKGRYMWKIVMLIAVISIGPIVFYVFGAIKFTNFSQYAYHLDSDNSTKVWASGTLGTAYFAWLPYTTWAYAGIESLSLITDLTNEPKKAIPHGMLGSVWILFASNLSLLFIIPSLPPGIGFATTQEFPLNTGYLLAYDLSPTTSAWLIVPAQFAMSAGFVLPAARLAQALADSTLLPPWLGLKNTGKRSALVKAMVMVCGFAYLLCIVGYLSPTSGNALQDMFLLSASVCYIAQIIGFILLRTTYKAESSGYKSPFGLVGAGYAIFIFVMLAISIVGNFQNDDDRAALMLLIFFIGLTMYYFYVCKERQTISKDEYASIFRFTIIKFNNIKRNAKRNANKKPKEGLMHTMRLTWKKILIQSTDTASKLGYSDGKTSVNKKTAKVMLPG